MEIRKNDIRELTVEKMAGSLGLARPDGFTVFVRGALTGEKVRARVEKAEKHCAFCKALEVLCPSKERREPDCPVYARCGGCDMRHMTYDMTLRIKQEHVRDVQQRLGGFDLEGEPLIGMEEPRRYRNKIILPVQEVDGVPRAGYFSPRSHRLVPVEDCLLAPEAVARLVPEVLSWMREKRIPAYREDSHTGTVRHLMFRVNRQGDVMLVLIARQTPPSLEELAERLKGKEKLQSLILNLQPGKGNVILGEENRVIFGSPRLRDELAGNLFDISPQSFFQVNSLQAEKLYALALEYAELKGNEKVLDLYCGAGTISLMLARHCREVVGVETVEPAVRDAKSNAVLNGISNARFYAGDAEDVLPRLAQEGERFDAAVLDPPRKGCDERVLRTLGELRVPKIVYIACDPATQARDIRKLAEWGYRPERTRSVDMFCWTEHVETVCLLTHS